jgi:hypothetical protein
VSEQLSDDLRRSADWLEKQQHESGGWGEYLGAHPNVLNTAEAVLAMLKSGERNPGSNSIRRGIEYLTQRQTNEGPLEESGSWPRRVDLADGKEVLMADTTRSAFALQALQGAGFTEQGGPFARGLIWLLGAQNEDGGWGYTHGVESRLLPTCFALQVLLNAYDAQQGRAEEWFKKAIRGAVSCICAPPFSDDEDGSFGGPDELRWPHTLLALKTLKTAVRLGIGDCRPERIRDGDSWVEQAETAPRWANETIELEKDGQKSAYQFTHVTPALCLDLLGSDLQPGKKLSPASGRLAVKSLRLLERSHDPQTHGFGAIRPVSWATAKSMMGISSILPAVAEWPEEDLTAEPGGGQASISLLVALMILAVPAFALAYFDRLTLTIVPLVVLFLITLLALAGKLREESIVSLFKTAIDIIPKPSGKKEASEDV